MFISKLEHFNLQYFLLTLPSFKSPGGVILMLLYQVGYAYHKDFTKLEMLLAYY